MSLQLKKHNHQPLDIQTMTDEENWESTFKQLVEFKVKNGVYFSSTVYAMDEYIKAHGNTGWVPKYTPDSPKLGLWANDTRKQKRNGKLSISNQLALESIGFKWEEKPASVPFDSRFAEMFEATAEHIQVQGHGWVPLYTPEFPKLAIWARNIRHLKRKGKLHQSRVLDLERIGFEWEAPPSTSTEFNTTSQGTTENIQMRDQKGKEQLPIQSQPAIGFAREDESSSVPIDSKFTEMFQGAEEYIRAKGHGWIPLYTPEFPKLAIWARDTRYQKRKGKLRQSRVLALDRIGFQWEAPPRTSSVATKHSAISPATAECMQKQDQKGKGQLPIPSQPALEAIAPPREEPKTMTSSEDTIFAEMLQSSSKFILDQGHGWVPLCTPADPDLGVWANEMRVQKSKGVLAAARQSALDEVGFQWELLPSSHSEMFKAMLHAAADYIRVQGHGWVPKKTAKCPSLGRWAKNLRCRKRKGKLSAQKQLALENIGFLWEKSALINEL